MKIWHISDTHSFHNLLQIPENIDIIVFSGDESNYYEVYKNEPECKSFLDWFGNLPIKYKIMIAGNHSCLKSDTEFLTKEGWKLYDNITSTDLLATFNKEIIEYQPYEERYKGFTNNLLLLESNFHSQMITNNHRVYTKNSVVYAEDSSLNNLSETNLFLTGVFPTEDFNISDNMLRILNFIITDGSIVWRNDRMHLGERLHRIQFKLSKERKITLLCDLLDKEGIKYTKSLCKKSISNLLQPFYIRIYGEDMRKLCNLLDNKKTIPKYFRNLSVRQKKLFLEFYSNTDGYRNKSNSISITTIDKNTADMILEMSITCGLFCNYREYSPVNSGYKGSKNQYKIHISNTIGNGNRLKKSEFIGVDEIVCFQTKNQTLITKRNGRVAFTGNSYIAKHIKEFRELCKQKNIIYLENEGIEIEGLKFWGSPYSPTFGNWYFMKSRDKMWKLWDNIPQDTDVLITHTPPKNCLDLSYNKKHELEFCGCSNLLKAVFRIKPKLHLYGHIHSMNGVINAGVMKLSNLHTIFSNGSVVTDGKFGTLSSNGNIIEL